MKTSTTADAIGRQLSSYKAVMQAEALRYLEGVWLQVHRLLQLRGSLAVVALLVHNLPDLCQRLRLQMGPSLAARSCHHRQWQCTVC